MNDIDNEEAKSEVIKDKALCPNCLTANDPKADFCHKCATPMSTHATIDPIASIWARGDTWRKAVERPTKLIVLLGMWAIFGIPMLVYLFLIATIRNIVSPHPVIVFGTLTALIVLHAAILLKATKNYCRLKELERSRTPAAENDGRFPLIIMLCAIWGGGIGLISITWLGKWVSWYYFTGLLVAISGLIRLIKNRKEKDEKAQTKGK